MISLIIIIETLHKQEVKSENDKKKIIFSEYDEIFYIPNKYDKKNYLLTTIKDKKKPIKKKRNILKEYNFNIFSILNLF